MKIQKNAIFSIEFTERQLQVLQTWNLAKLYLSITLKSDFCNFYATFKLGFWRFLTPDFLMQSKEGSNFKCTYFCDKIRYLNSVKSVHSTLLSTLEYSFTCKNDPGTPPITLYKMLIDHPYPYCFPPLNEASWLALVSSVGICILKNCPRKSLLKNLIGCQLEITLILTAALPLQLCRSFLFTSLLTSGLSDLTEFFFDFQIMTNNWSKGSQ